MGIRREDKSLLPFEVIATVYAKYSKTDPEDLTNRDYKAARIAEQYTEAELRQAVVMRRQYDIYNAEGEDKL